MRILLVDDDESSLTSLKIALQQGGCEVEAAPGGERALEILKRKEFDYLVTDGYMGGVNGFDLAREAMSLRPKMKRVLISGFYQDNEVVHCLFSKLYQKPVDVEDLLGYLRR